MRTRYHRALAPAILLWTLAVVPVASAAFPWNARSSPVSHSLRLQTPPHTRPPDDRPLITKIRDGISQTIWGAPPNDQPDECCGSTSLTKSTCPPSLSAKYGGDVVLRFQMSTADEAAALAEAANTLFLDVWEFTPEWVDIRLAKDVVPSLLGLLPKSLQHAHTPLMHDLAQSIFESYPSPASAGQTPPAYETHRSFTPLLHSQPEETNIFFRDYQPLRVMIPWMRLLTSLFQTHVRMISVGTSYEGRDIYALRVGVHPTSAEKPPGPRKTILISGGTHPREWISTSTVNYAAYSLITAYGRDRDLTKLVEEFDWVFIPTMNPDGYVYTWENDRLWRKNRQQTNLRFCKGLDLDRAYGFQWDGQASSSNPCSESFSGDGPFEGVEARKFATWVRNETEHNNVNFVGFLDFHSYSQQVLYPFSYSCTDSPPLLENLEELALGLAKSIHHTEGAAYGVTSACEGSVTTKQKQKSKREKDLWPRIENSGGSALDWMYHDMHVKYAYQIKLRDTGSYGFLLPSKDIVPTGKEIFSAVQYFGKFLLSNKGIEKVENATPEEFVRGKIYSGSSTASSTEAQDMSASTLPAAPVESEERSNLELR